MQKYLFTTALLLSSLSQASTADYFKETANLIAEQHNLTFEGKIRGNICGRDNETVFLSEKSGKNVYAFQLGSEPSGAKYTSGYASLYNITDCTLHRFYVAY